MEARVLDTKLTGGISGLWLVSRSRDIPGILLGLRAVYRDIQLPVFTLIFPADIPGDDTGTVIVGVGAEPVVPARSGFRALRVFLAEPRVYLMRRGSKYTHQLRAEDITVRAGILDNAVFTCEILKLTEKLVYREPRYRHRFRPCVHLQHLHKAVPDIYFVLGKNKPLVLAVIYESLYKITDHIPSSGNRILSIISFFPRFVKIILQFLR